VAAFVHVASEMVFILNFELRQTRIGNHTFRATGIHGVSQKQGPLGACAGAGQPRLAPHDQAIRSPAG
jgi:hypothetical protein